MPAEPVVNEKSHLLKINALGQQAQQGKAPDEKPPWLKIKPPKGEGYAETLSVLHSSGLNTVCSSARCPNMPECWGKRTATFMVLGNTCTRHCGFCAVKSARLGEEVDSSEPKRLAEAVSRLGLRYVVLTSVTRDDLADGGAAHFAACMREIKRSNPRTLVEVLIPDFKASKPALKKVVAAKPSVVGHNIETVRRLQKKARSAKSEYETSLQVLSTIKKISPAQKTKSGIMLGIGETQKEVLDAMHDLRSAGADILTIGQYLKHATSRLCVERYIPPDEFAAYKKAAEEAGFSAVASAPFVRSSYMAAALYAKAVHG